MFLCAGLAAQEPTPPPPFAEGSRWRGKTAEDGAVKHLRVIERNGDVVRLQVEGFAAGAVFQFHGKVRNGVVTIDDIRRTKNPKGSNGVAMHEPAGSMNLLPDGKLSVSVTAQMRGNGAARSWAFVCNAAEPQPSATKSAPQDPYQAGKRWRGKTVEDGALKDIRILERRGDVVAFEAQGFAAGAIFRVEGKLVGNTVKVDSIRRSRQPKGHKAVSMHKPFGTIKVLPSGRLSVNIGARMHGNGTTRGWTFACPRAEAQ